MNEEDIRKSIQHGIQQALQPLLDRVEALEQTQKSQKLELWSLNQLVYLLMEQYPDDQRQQAAQLMKMMLNSELAQHQQESSELSYFQTVIGLFERSS
jgi:hypothetical protein